MNRIVALKYCEQFQIVEYNPFHNVDTGYLLYMLDQSLDKFQTKFQVFSDTYSSEAKQAMDKYVNIINKIVFVLKKQGISSQLIDISVMNQ